MPPDSLPPPETLRLRVYVKRGLEGQDDNIDLLLGYFKELQAATVETSVDLDLDLLTFAIGSHYFGVVMLEEIEERPEHSSCNRDADHERDADGEPEDESIDVDVLDPRPLSTHQSSESGGTGSDCVAPTPPNGKKTPEGLRAISKEEYLALPEQERVLRWREAFNAEIYKESDSEDEDEVTRPSLASFPPPVRRDQQLHGDEGELGPLDVNNEDNTFDGFVSWRRNARSDLWTVPRQSNTAKGSQINADDFINWPEDAPSPSAHHSPPSTTGCATGSEEDESELSSIYGHQPREVDENLGREYLEPDLDTRSLPAQPEIPENEELQQVILKSAHRYREELRARRVAEFQERQIRRNSEGWPRPRTSPPPPSPLRKVSKPIGLTYLATSQHFQDPLHIGECNIGVYIAPEFRDIEGIPEAIDQVVEFAFTDKDCHRLQAIVVENEDKWHSLNLLTTAGFRQEGIRRRAFYSPFGKEWKDVTYFAILATEWFYDRNNSPTSSIHLRPRSLWDEVITRHQRERDELVKLQEKECSSGRLKRTNSMETIRERVPTVDYYPSDSASVSGFTTDSSIEREPGKRRRVESSGVSGGSQASGSRPPSSAASFTYHRDPFASGDVDSDWEIPTFGNPLKYVPSSNRRSQNSTAGPSTSRKRPSISSASSSASWDMME
ncbi:hypothetical protein NLJ89_g10799 [Agrocybe chaxingu]|uniref:N-acetyltransferase domain-containing protein n=1 Tax=Agrocybe chaxingu TaxID=84603 RepID=A0A9W8MNK7_9AGAR|nr:hypothetical protein NLJ89_g10799 [Agrocybe chaxingu]